MPSTTSESSVEVILLKGNVLVRADVSEIVKRIEKAITDQKTSVRIRGEKEWHDIDILLIAYLALYRASMVPLTFQIWLHQSSKESDLHRKLLQYRMHAEYSARIEIFGLYFWDGVNDDTATVESNTPAEKDLWEDAKSFAPTLIISPETIGPLFFDSFDPAIVSKFSLPDFHNVNDTLRRRFSDSCRCATRGSTSCCSSASSSRCAEWACWSGS